MDSAAFTTSQQADSADPQVVGKRCAAALSKESMKLTIFTPTYNRADKLHQIYKSLLKQNTTDDFEWLIIDDGSSDNTEEIVQTYLDNPAVHARYYRKENGGKHTAHNMALDLARGDYFMCLDSDDYLEDNALSKVFSALDALITCGLIAYKALADRTLISNEFPERAQVESTYALSSKYNCHGEFVLIYPTETFRQHPFPVFRGEKFVTECVVYDQIQCPMRLLPEIVQICEYQPEGLSRSVDRVMKTSPAGYCVYFMQRIDLQESFSKRLFVAGKYNCFCHFAKQQRTRYQGRHKLLVFAAKPVGILFWLYYKLIRKF